MEFDSAITL